MQQTLVRLLVAGRFGYSTDEAHYALFARRPAWGYLEHPPMVAFLGAFTGLFGQSVFFARLGPIYWPPTATRWRRSPTSPCAMPNGCRP